MSWIDRRIEELNKTVEKLCTGHKKYVFARPHHINPNREADPIFSPHYEEDIAQVVGSEWTLLNLNEARGQDVIVILTTHASDMTPELWAFRQSIGSESVLCGWHFDNHLSQIDNIKNSLAIDFGFPSHSYAVTDYLYNPVSPVVDHVPLCSCQFSRAETIEWIYDSLPIPRQDKAVFNYVLYDFSPRTKPLLELSQQISDVADFKLMPASDRSRYKSLSRRERFSEWAYYKSSVIMPMTHDLSTRFFDSLATGQVPIVPSWLVDLDQYLPSEELLRLGVVRVDSYDPSVLRKAIRTANQRFDADGIDGILYRARYALTSGSLGARIKQILENIERIGQNVYQLYVDANSIKVRKY